MLFSFSKRNSILNQLESFNCVKTEFKKKGKYSCDYILDNSRLTFIHIHYLDVSKKILRCKTLEELILIYPKLPDNIWKLPNLKKLTLWIRQPYNFNRLSNLHKLEDLEIVTKQSLDLKFLKNYPFLKSLKVVAPKITNVDVLLKLPQLIKLSIDAEVDEDLNKILQQTPQIKDLKLAINPKSKAPQIQEIKHLSLSRIDQSELEKLKQYPNLEKLEILFSKFTTLEPISHLNKLKEIKFFDVDVPSIKPLTTLHELKSLLLPACDITDFSGLENCPNLEIFSIDRMSTIDQKTLKFPQTLKYLRIGSTSIDDYQIFRPKPQNLEFISTIGNKFKKEQTSNDFELLAFMSQELGEIFYIVPMVGLTMDKAKFISYTQKQVYDEYRYASRVSFDNEGNLIGLKYNFAENFKTLPQIILDFKELRHLFLEGSTYSKISSLEGINKLEKLRTLCVRNNNIRKIQNNYLPKTLIYLDIAKNPLSSFTCLAHLRNLRYLDISKTGIKSIRGIKNLKQIRYLSISIDKIESNIDELKQLTNLKQLTIWKGIRSRKVIKGQEKIKTFLETL